MDVHVAPDGSAVYLATSVGAYATDAATGSALWDYTYYQPLDWDDLRIAYSSALSADGSTLLLTKPAFSTFYYTQATSLRTSDGRNHGGLGFAMIPGDHTFTLDSALSPDGGIAYFVGAVGLELPLGGSVGEAFALSYHLTDHGWGTEYTLAEVGAPAAADGAFLSADGQRFYVTGFATAPDGTGLLHATAYDA